MSFTTLLDHLNKLRKIVLYKSRRKKCVQTLGRHCWRLSDGSLSPSSLRPWQGLAYFLFTDHLLTHILCTDNLTLKSQLLHLHTVPTPKGLEIVEEEPYLKRPFAPDFKA